MVSALDFGSSGPGLSTGRGHFVILEQDIHITQVCEWVLANLMVWVTLRWTSMPPTGE